MPDSPRDIQRTVNKLVIPPYRVASMVWSYARTKIGDQVRSTAFVVLYLAFVQIFILKTPIVQSLAVAAGIGFVVIGLALFLEGLFIGIMPLGETCGLKLPGKAGPAAAVVFSLFLGATATLAEPAIGFLKAQGAALAPWDAPLLYWVLNAGSSWLVGAVCLGVGIAVAIGLFRFLYGWPLKPFIYIFVPTLIAASFWLDLDPSARQSLGLAWDTGGVTTGPVTVPLVLALGIGVSRITGSGDKASSGLGVVTLASLLPVASVLALAVAVSPLTPPPGGKEAFFSADIRPQAVFVAGSPEKLEILGNNVLDDESFKECFPLSPGRKAAGAEAAAAAATGFYSRASVFRAFTDACKAVIPLVGILLVSLVVFLRERLRETDALVLGFVFAVSGMFLFNLGMEGGLANLGKQAGASLPRAYSVTERPEAAVLVGGVGESDIQKAAGTTGGSEYLLLETGRGPSLVPFDRGKFDAATGTYTHVPREPAVFGGFGSWAAIVAIFAFSFILGIGATLAEPSLSALGAKIEEITTGTFKKGNLVMTVALGVGMGLAAGFARIYSGFPLTWLLSGAYGTALVLTLFSSEDFAAIAWDAAGVTTGPVTVPLVIATGLGVGGTNPADSFGVVAAASVFPIVAVLLSGIISDARSRSRLGLGRKKQGRAA